MQRLKRELSASSRFVASRPQNLLYFGDDLVEIMRVPRRYLRPPFQCLENLCSVSRHCIGVRLG